MNNNCEKDSTSWPFQEAAKIKCNSGKVIFETGFGPSGRPHIGTFAEVARTIMVQNAFSKKHPNVETELYAFCDDMDGLRKVPLNLLDKKDMLIKHLGEPLSVIPDPFGTEKSYAAHMERELNEFLSRFGFRFELKSSAEEYSSGAFNSWLKKIFEYYDEVRALVIPTLGEQNRERWSPFIPICKNCRKLYTTVVTSVNRISETISYECNQSYGQGDNRVDGCGYHGETPIIDGLVKVGWKVDWALRWCKYKVCYEMYGKDLIDSAKLSSKITTILGGTPPAGMTYELFLDEDGKKISKSVGEGLTVESWMDFAPIQSLLYYLFQNPRKQRKLYFDVIPKSTDDFLDDLRNYSKLSECEMLDSSIWHISNSMRHEGNIHTMGQLINEAKSTNLDVLLLQVMSDRRGVPTWDFKINYSIILNLISALGYGDEKLLLDYISRYDPNVDNNKELIVSMVRHAVKYYKKMIEPGKKYRMATEQEKCWFRKLEAQLKMAAEEADENELQGIVFTVGGADAKLVFKAIYEVLLGQERGPRFGTFAKLLGRDRTLELLRSAL